jgi:ribonuclease E
LADPVVSVAATAGLEPPMQETAGHETAGHETTETANRNEPVLAMAAADGIGEDHPLPAVEPSAVAPAAPDPSEVASPPAMPRRGWWRRGA